MQFEKVKMDVPKPKDGVFREMSVGECIKVGPGEDAKAIRALAGNLRRFGLKFKTKTIDGSLHVWRVE